MSVVHWLRLLWAKVRYSLSWFVTIVLAIVGLTGGVAGLAPNLNVSKSTEEIIQSSALVGITILSLGALAYREISRERRRKLNDTALRRHNATAIILDLYSFLALSLQQIRDGEAPDRNGMTRAREMMEEIIDEYAYVFSQLASTRCRICVKLITASGNVPFVYTLARDRISARENAQHDETRERELLDKLEDNTDFAELFDPEAPDQGYFFANDLPKQEAYSSSSINYWTNVARDPNTPFRKNWSLPYKSTIVWPIRIEAKRSLGIDKDKCVGFLAVDSAARHAFNREIDTFVGSTLARQLYPPLKLYAELDEAIREREGNDE